MVKVVLQLYPVLPAADEAERIALRPIGRNKARYQETLRGWNEIIQAADRLGVWGAATIEHHFHSEGYEVGPNPGVLNAYWAAITKNIRVGQLGYVMSAQNPFRVAEEVAILDHLSQGRCFVGFARGYQARWTQVLGQHLGAPPTLSDGSADDQRNRAIFEEQVAMVLRAWTQESVTHNSDLWQIPYPYEAGVANWPMINATRKLGARDEASDAGTVQRISVVPAPYSDPHPPVFVATTASPASIEYCGRHGFIPNFFTPLEASLKQGPTYLEAARAAGYTVELGQNVAQTRIINIAASTEEARRRVAAYDADIWKHFYNPFYAAFGGPKEDATDPEAMNTEELVDEILASGLWKIGTAAQVRDELVEEWTRFPTEYITLIFHYAQQPKESVIENLERFMREVKPALDELTAHYETTPMAPATAGD